MYDEPWEDYPDFDAPVIDNARMLLGDKYKCPFCQGIKEFGRKCVNCINEKSGKTIQGLNASDLCKCGHIRKYHCRPDTGRRTGKMLSVCMVCWGMENGCVNFEVNNV